MPTLLDLYRSHGIPEPDLKKTNLPPQLFTIDLASIRGFDITKAEKVQPLLYYTSLFVRGYARINSQMMAYLYIDIDNSLKGDLAKDAIKNMELLGTAEQSTFAGTYPRLRRAITPQALATLCLENCPPLEGLFRRAFEKDGLNRKTLCDSYNPFLLGYYFRAKDLPNFVISKQDTEILQILGTVATEATPSTTGRQNFLNKSTLLAPELKPFARISQITHNFLYVPVFNIDYIVSFLIDSAKKPGTAPSNIELEQWFEAISDVGYLSGIIGQLKTHPEITSLLKQWPSFCGAMLTVIEHQLVSLRSAAATTDLQIKWFETLGMIYQSLEPTKTAIKTSGNRYTFSSPSTSISTPTSSSSLSPENERKEEQVSSSSSGISL